MRLRAKVGFDHLNGIWTVTLWCHDARNLPHYFGQRVFDSWGEALRWAIWRVRHA